MIVVLSFLDYGSLLRPVGRLHVKSNAAGGFLDDLMPRWLSSWFHINQSRGNRYGGKIQSLHRGFNFHAVRISHHFFFGVPYMKPIIPHQSPNDTYSILDGPLSQVLALLLECSQPMLAKEPIPQNSAGWVLVTSPDLYQWYLVQKEHMCWTGTSAEVEVQSFWLRNLSLEVEHKLQYILHDMVSEL